MPTPTPPQKPFDERPKTAAATTPPPGTVFEWLATSDGTEIRTAHWLPQGKPRGTIIVLQGRREFIEKYFETVADLLARGFAVAALDWRGQGLSSRLLANPHKGHVENFDLYLADLDAVTGALPASQPRPYWMLAHSMGGHVALRYLHDHPGLIEKAVLTAPMIGINFGLLAGISKTLVRLMMATGRGERYALAQGDYSEKARKAEANLLSSSPARLAVEIHHCRENPALALGGVTYGWLDAAFRSIRLLTQPGYAEAIKTPVLIVTAGADKVVSTKAQTAIARRLAHGRQVVIPGARHEILMERDDLRAQFWAAFDDFTGEP